MKETVQVTLLTANVASVEEGKDEEVALGARNKKGGTDVPLEKTFNPNAIAESISEFPFSFFQVSQFTSIVHLFYFRCQSREH